MISRRDFLTLLAASFSSALIAIPARADDAATQQLNDIRKANGVALLMASEALTRMAHYQANLMAAHRKLSHTVTWGNGFVSRLRKFQIHGPAGENLCAGQKDLASAYKAWMNSPKHRRNMLDPVFRHYGLAKASSPEKPHYYYWAIVFGL